jgi:hypothetical protein
MRALLCDVTVMATALALGLLGLAVHFHTDIPGHCSATYCVCASVALGYIALAAAALRAVVPEPTAPSVSLPRATLRP